MKPFVKGQKNDYNDAETIAEAALRPNLRVVREKTQDQLDLQALHRVRSRLVSRRTATINQIRAFLIEQGITVRTGAGALRNSLLAILENRQDEISSRMRGLIVGLYEDWICLYQRIEALTGEIDQIGEKEANCRRPGAREEYGRDGEADRFCCLQIDRQLKSGWLLDREVSRGSCTCRARRDSCRNHEMRHELPPLHSTFHRSLRRPAQSIRSRWSSHSVCVQMLRPKRGAGQSWDARAMR